MGRPGSWMKPAPAVSGTWLRPETGALRLHRSGAAASATGWHAGESPAGRIGRFTTENCVGEWGGEALRATMPRIEQAGPQ